MNDLEHEIREALRRHEDDAPTFDTAEARRAAGRAHRRQVRNVVVGGIVGAAAVIVALAGLSGLVRADQPPTVLDSPLPSSAATPDPSPLDFSGSWPGPSRNPAGVDSWDGSPYQAFPDQTLGLIHDGYKPGSSDVNLVFQGHPGRLIPHRGQTMVTVAGYEGTYRRFIGEDSPAGWMNGLPSEEWMVDLQGTTVTILLIEEPRARETELAEAHEIIGSIRMAPQDNDLGFRLDFTVTTDTWDSG